MKELEKQTEREVREMTQSAIDKYTHFAQNMEEWKNSFGGKFATAQHSMRENFMNQVRELEELKEDFEKLFVPYIFSQIKGQIDNYDPEYLGRLENKLTKLKKKLDSDTFRYIEFPYHNLPNPHEVSRWPMFVFIASAVICLLCSATFHLFYPMSARTSSLMQVFTLCSRGWTTRE